MLKKPAKINEEIKPDHVLLGLIDFINFGPFMYLPIKKPPISEDQIITKSQIIINFPLSAWIFKWIAKQAGIVKYIKEESAIFQFNLSNDTTEIPSK